MNIATAMCARFLPGFGVEAILDGLSNTRFSDCAVHRDRRLIGQPLDFGWDIRNYIKGSEELTAGNLEAMQRFASPGWAFGSRPKASGDGC